MAYRKPRPNIRIVGSHSKVHELPIFGTEEEIWVFNGKGCTLPRYDLVFQMHLPEDWGGQWSRNWLRDNVKIPVIMREMHLDAPMAVQYPFEEVFGMLAHVRHNGKTLKYFTSSIAWAIALAVLQERQKISVYGIEMQDDEYARQKDCFAFWVGFAAGRGIELEINCANNIFNKPLYGAQREP